MAAYWQRVRGVSSRRFLAAIPLAILAAALVPMPMISLLAALYNPGGLEERMQILRDLPTVMLASLFLLPAATILTLIGGLPAHLALVALRGGLGAVLPFLGAVSGSMAAQAFRAVWRPLT